MRNKISILSFLKSLRFRLMLLLLLSTILPGTLFFIGFISIYESRAVSVLESESLCQVKILANQIGSSGYLSTPNADHDSLQENPALDAQIHSFATTYGGRVMILNEYFEIVEDTYNRNLGDTMTSEEVITSYQGKDNTYYDKDSSYLEITVPIHDPNGSIGTVQGVLLVSVSGSHIQITRSSMLLYACLLALILDIVCLILAIMAIYWLLLPLDKLMKEADAMKSGIGFDKIEVNDCTETQEISKSLNGLMNRMKLMDESRQEFVSNVSHELKTPMTSIKVLADSINSMPNAPLELYQEFMADITNEIERETKIISDLLSLAKLDKSTSDLNIQPIVLNDMLIQILKRLQPIADRQKVELVLESFHPISAEIDEVKMTLAITNLVENAIKYNKNDGTGYVHVSLNADNQYFYIKVEDSGMGIPQESIPYIFDRFYRVDKSHSREIGGTGLGLAITRSCILMHRGAIKVDSRLGEGTTFDVRVPLTYTAKKKAGAI